MSHRSASFDWVDCWASCVMRHASSVHAKNITNHICHGAKSVGFFCLGLWSDVITMPNWVNTAAFINHDEHCLLVHFRQVKYHFFRFFLSFLVARSLRIESSQNDAVCLVQNILCIYLVYLHAYSAFNSLEIFSLNFQKLAPSPSSAFATNGLLQQKVCHFHCIFYAQTVFWLNQFVDWLIMEFTRDWILCKQMQCT